MDTTTSLKILSPSQSALDSKPNTSKLEGLDVKEAWHNFLDWYNNVKEIFFSFSLFFFSTIHVTSNSCYSEDCTLHGDILPSIVSPSLASHLSDHIYIFRLLLLKANRRYCTNMVKIKEGNKRNKMKVFMLPYSLPFFSAFANAIMRSQNFLSP